MTPNDIDVLLHCHVSPSPHPRINTPAVQYTINMFIKNGILKLLKEGVYGTTDRGKALVDLLCSTPFPKSAWVDAHMNVIRLSIDNAE